MVSGGVFLYGALALEFQPGKFSLIIHPGQLAPVSAVTHFTGMAHLQHVFRFSFCHLTPGPAGGITVRPLVARTVRHDSCCRGSEQLSVHSTLQENGILTLEIKTKEEDRLLSRDCSMRLPLVAASSGRLGSLARMRIDMLEYSGTDPKILEACRALIDSGIQEELVHALLSTEGYIGMSPGPDAQRGGFRYAS